MARGGSAVIEKMVIHQNQSHPVPHERKIGVEMDALQLG